MDTIKNIPLRTFVLLYKKLTKICCIGVSYSAIDWYSPINKYSCYNKID